MNRSGLPTLMKMKSKSPPIQEPVGLGRDGAGKSAISAEQAAVALLSLAIADREDRLKLLVASQPGKAPIRRSEAILADVGLSLGQIAAVTGKPYKVVEGLVRRDRESRTRADRTAAAPAGPADG